jgi:hypothetical protein
VLFEPEPPSELERVVPELSEFTQSDEFARPFELARFLRKDSITANTTKNASGTPIENKNPEVSMMSSNRCSANARRGL